MFSGETVELEYRRGSRRWAPVGGAWTLLGVTGYFVMSSLTLPFKGAFWLGELPLLTLLQLPKVMFARWLRIDLVMPAIKSLGWSRGSFSPDYLMARPYALALAYLIFLAVLFGGLWLGGRLLRGYRKARATALPAVHARALWVCIVLLAGVIDFAMTLWFAGGPGLSFY